MTFITLERNSAKIRVVLSGGRKVQLNNRAVNKVAPPTADELAKVNSIIARGIARAENLPLRSSEQIWEEFDAVWDSIAAQAK